MGTPGRIIGHPRVLRAASDARRTMRRDASEHMAPASCESHSAVSFVSGSCSSTLEANPGPTPALRCHSRAGRALLGTGMGAVIPGSAQVQPLAAYADIENAAPALEACPRCHVDSNLYLDIRVTIARGHRLLQIAFRRHPDPASDPTAGRIRGFSGRKLCPWAHDATH